MMKKILMTTLLLVSACAQMMAEDADSLYAKDLLKPGTVASDFMLRSNLGEMKTFSNYRGSYVVPVYSCDAKFELQCPSGCPSGCPSECPSEKRE